MKKKRLIVLLSILIVVAVIGCLTFLYRAAAAEKDAFYKEYITSNEVVERLSQFPQEIELGRNSMPGYTIHFQDYSLTMSGYKDVATDKDINDDYIARYTVNGDKYFTLSKYWGSILNSPGLMQIEKAAGRKINTEYDYWKASFYCTPDDFSMFDIEKNKGVYALLETKYNGLYFGNRCYQFDNGVIKGFICDSSGDFATVLFSNCDVSDSCYGINFISFSTEEVKEILSTITFGGSEANQ